MLTIPDTMIPLVRTVRTKDERDALREEAAKLEAALFRQNPKELDTILRTRFSEERAAIMRDIFQRTELKDNTEALRLFLRHLDETLDALPLLKISLAFKPAEEMIHRLHDWMEKNIGSGMVLDIDYDASMLGGARIIFGGKYKEITLAHMINDVFTKEQAAIRGMIK